MALFKALRHTWVFEDSGIEFPAFQFEIARHDVQALDALNRFPLGLCFDGTNWYVVNQSESRIYKYNSDFTAAVASYPVGADYGNHHCWGIIWKSPYFYVCDTVDNTIYVYNSDFSAHVTSHFVGGLGDNDSPAALVWVAPYWYVTDESEAVIYKYDEFFTELKGTFTGISGYWGITWDGEYFYTVYEPGALVYKWTKDFVAVETFDIGDIGGDDDPTGIFYYDNNFYIVDWALDEGVYQYPAATLVTVSGHNTTLTINDGLYYDFLTPHMTGVVEFYLYSKDITQEVAVILKDGTGNECIKISIDASKIIGDGSDALDPALNYRIYHLKIDFDCTPNTYDLYVNSVKELTAEAFGTVDDGSGLTQIYLACDADSIGYIDAIGFDWDAGYTEGDNLTDTEDVTENITYVSITEGLGRTSKGKTRIKGAAISEFIAGHEIDFYDSSDVLSWVGRIIAPKQVQTGTVVIGEMDLKGVDSQFENLSRKNFTTVRDSDYIIKYMIDNFLARYHSYNDEIDNFTIEYKYDMKKKIWKSFDYLKFLERAIIHYLPSGEIFFNKYDNLSASGLSWIMGTTDNVKIVSYTPAYNNHITRAPVIGGYNSDGQIYVVGVASTQNADEDQFGINELPTWRDGEITNYTEAAQLATNLQALYNLDTRIFTILTAKLGHQQVGYTTEIKSTDVFVVPQNNYLLIKRVWLAHLDLSELTFTDNILAVEDL